MLHGSNFQNVTSQLRSTEASLFCHVLFESFFLIQIQSDHMWRSYCVWEKFVNDILYIMYDPLCPNNTQQVLNDYPGLFGVF